MKRRENRLLKMFSNGYGGEVSGIYSVCSANKFVIEAAMLQAKIDGTPLLLEATSNQVNQFGGYTGMTPDQFVIYVRNIAKQVDFPFEKVILGGDHLGPYTWRSEEAKDALEKAQELVRKYVSAGFTKIHLDPSMRCADDHGDETSPLDKSLVAERTASLCFEAELIVKEKSNGSIEPVYVIGSEVPRPGGAPEKRDEPKVTSVKDVQTTLEITEQAFLSRGLESAWERVIAVVVQPGVEFSSASVTDYRPQKTRFLSQCIENYDPIIFETHSTDFQT